MDYFSIVKHVCALIIILGVSILFCNTSFNKKEILNPEHIQELTLHKDISDYNKQSDSKALWTNRNFAGMPLTGIDGLHPTNISLNAIQWLKFKLGKETHALLLLILCFYIGMVSLGYSPVLSLFGALIFGFSTNNLILIGTGDISKALAIAFAVPVLSGSVLLAKNKWISGAVLITIFSSLLWATNSTHIAYLLFLIILLCALAFVGKAVYTRSYRSLVKCSYVFLASIIIGFLPNISLLSYTHSVAKESIIGKPILKDGRHSRGLDKKQASEYSSDFFETMSYIFPRIKGGSSQEKMKWNNRMIPFDEERNFQPENQEKGFIIMPMYFGGQPDSSGPVYIGVLFFFFFLVSLFFISKKKRWFFSSLILLTILLAWGKNSPGIYDLFYKVVPFFDRFDAPVTIFAFTNIFIIWTIIEGFTALKKRPFVIDKVGIGVKYLFVILLGLTGIVFATSDVLFDYKANYGKEETGVSVEEDLYDAWVDITEDRTYAELLIEKLRKDRKKFVRIDAARAFFIIGLGVLLFLFYYKNYMSFYGLLGTVFLIGGLDLWDVGTRYVNAQDFTNGATLEDLSDPLPPDDQILELATAQDRVLDVTTNVFHDARPNFFHNNIGGNHPYKLRRYQDIIDNYLIDEIGIITSGRRSGFTPALNMLNCRFIKYNQGENKYLENLTAFGSAWFPKQIIWVGSDQEELESIERIASSEQVIIHEEFLDYIGGYHPYNANFEKISLLRYEPGFIEYQVTSSVQALIVFSELWYKGNEDWKVRMDGESASMIRANYLLRAMLIPQGVHSISFEFRPTSYDKGKIWSFYGSGAFLLLLASLVFFLFKGKE